MNLETAVTARPRTQRQALAYEAPNDLTPERAGIDPDALQRGFWSAIVDKETARISNRGTRP
jgi:hypothetical protein